MVESTSGPFPERHATRGPAGSDPASLELAVQPGDAIWLHPGIGLTARVLFTLIFFLSGVTHFTDVPRYVGLMPEAIPFKELLVLLSGAVELAGALAILLNYRPRLGAWLLVLFLVPVTIAVHGVAMFSAPTAEMRGIQSVMFMKGLTMTGAALFLTQLGVALKRR